MDALGGSGPSAWGGLTIRRRRVGQRSLYALFLVAAAEILCRSGWPTLARSERLAPGTVAVARLAGETSPRQSLVSHPYMLFWNKPGFSSLGYRQTNSLGYRNPAEPAAVKGLRVLALGGSTTWSFPYVPDPARTWTALVEQHLRERHAAPPVEVLNAGAAFATSAELLAHYVFRGQHLHPDVVILHEGINDVMPLSFPDYSPEYTHVRQSSNLLPRPLERPLLKHVYLARLAYLMWLFRHPTVYTPQPLPFAAIPRADALRRVRSTEPEGFRRNLETLIKLARENGSRVLLVGSLLARRERIAIGYPAVAGLEDVMIEGVAKHHRVMGELAARHSDLAVFVELDQTAFRDEWFLDFCHLSEPGEREKARQIGVALATMLGL